VETPKPEIVTLKNEIVSVTPIVCKNCGSEAVMKWGKYKGVQRYYCKSCNRKFKADDDLYRMKVPSEYVSNALSEYYSGMSVNDICTNLKQEHGYYPSNSVVYKWIDKYTPLAINHFKDYHPQVGDVWIADETMLNLDGEHSIWFYDIIDRDTRFLLASRVAISRTTTDAQILMERAEKCAGKKPKEVLTDQNRSYEDGIEKAYGSDTEHVIGNPFKEKETGESTSEIERFHGTLKDRTKVFRSFRDIDTLIQFTDGWLVYYNYFRPHESLEGKTPAEAGKIQYDVKDWAELIKIPVPKHRIELVDLPKPKRVKNVIDTSKLFNRKRGHRAPKTSRGDLYVGNGMVSRHPFRGGKARRGKII
jgi:transposase-like protein